MTHPAISSIRARLEAATPGKWEALPWETENGGKDWNVFGPKASNHPRNKDLRGDFGSETDATFVAYAPTDISTLLSLHDEQQGRIERLEAALREIADHYVDSHNETTGCPGNEAMMGAQDLRIATCMKEIARAALTGEAT